MKPGDWYWFQDGSSFVPVQLIELLENGSWLVRSFWPKPGIPASVDELEVKSECTELWIPDSAVLFFHSELPAHSEDEKKRYFSIKHSLGNRNAAFENGLEEVKARMAAGNFSEAIELLNRIGPIQKRNPEIYLLRARCFQQLGDAKAAEYDYDFYCQLGGAEGL